MLAAGSGRWLAALVAVLALLAAAPSTAEPLAPHALTAADAGAWLDGMLPYALAQGDIAGAVVVVVHDGQVLTLRGYGFADVAARLPVDPERTLFRPGSTSKLFTWTAVMQLVEQGRLDLDTDINRYLDFRIPAYEGKPVTMRHLMTHTPGFEQALKHLIVFSGLVPPLGEALRERLPPQVFAPGSTPAYSNYGVALAGYIVERVAGMPFEDYIERHVFAPLGMARATFRQPLPAVLAPWMAKGYARASAPAEPFEIVTLPPAGGAAVSGADMAKFMIAHLDSGARLLRPATAALMHAPATAAIPGTDGMALGFYEQRVNGVRAIAHAGDAINFHSDLWLFPAQRTGLYISMNSEGLGRATHEIRLALFQQFARRYFAAAADGPRLELATAREHARQLSGHYIASTGSFTNFIDAANFLGQTVVGLDDDGRPRLEGFPGLGGAPRHWIEVAPFQWQDADGPEHLAAEVRNGRVIRFAIDDDAPVNVFMRAAWYRDTTWVLPSFLGALFVTALAALSWPVAAALTRFHRLAPTLSGRDLLGLRAARILAWLLLAVLGGWLSILTPRQVVMADLDATVWCLQLAGSVAAIGLAGITLWNLWHARHVSGRRLARISLAAQAIASLVMLWVLVAFHLVRFGTHF